MRGGLELIAGSHSSHYDGEVERRPTCHRLIADGNLPDGYAADNCEALVFDGGVLVKAVGERNGALAYRVERRDGVVAETALPTRHLP